MNVKYVPTDAGVRYGQLENGVTYYVCRNPMPKGKAELRLAVRAGSVMEDEHERGLAHFTEHMAFKGSRHFPGTGVIRELSALGVEFGADLNAYTGFDRTVYIIPIASSHLLTGVRILADWAFGLTMDAVAVDSERGVILEELRTGQGAEERLRNKWFPKVFRGSKYSSRMPIGIREVISGAPRDVLYGFYKRWYRPDNIAVIIVGDVDEDEAIRMVRDNFGSVQAPLQALPQGRYDIPLEDNVRAMVFTDPESQYATIQIINKLPALQVNTEDDYRKFVLRHIYANMLSSRLKEMSQGVEPRFLYGSAMYAHILKPSDALMLFAVSEPEKVKEALEAVLVQMETAQRYGFSQSELLRASASHMNELRSRLSEKDKTDSKNLAGEYVLHFTDGYAVPGIEYEYDFCGKLLGGLTVKQLNDLGEDLYSRDLSILVSGNDKDAQCFPDEKEVMSVWEHVRSSDCARWEDRDAGRDTLVEDLPEKGSVRSVREIESIGLTRVEFGGGVVVLLLPSENKNDEIVFSAIRKGGRSGYDDYISSFFASKAAEESGLGDLDKTMLFKFLSDKTVSVSTSVDTYQDTISGYSSVKDVKTLFELIYQQFTACRMDRGVFDTVVRNDCAVARTALDDPQEYFEDYVKRVLCCDDPRGEQLTPPDELARADYENARKIRMENFSRGEDFTFAFAGRFTVEGIMPYLLQYIAPLGKGGDKSDYVDMGIRPPYGMFRGTVYKGVDDKAVAALIFDTPTHYSLEKATAFAALGEVLKIKLIQRLRSRMSAVYGIRVAANFIRVPYEHSFMRITVPCAPDMVDVLVSAVLDEIEAIKKEGPSPGVVDEVVATRNRKITDSLQSNKFCLMQIQRFCFFGDPLDRLATLKDESRFITVESIRDAARELVDTDAYIRLVMLPERFKGLDQCIKKGRDN